MPASEWELQTIGGSLGSLRSYVHHTDQNRRYFSSTDASIYFKDVELAEIVRIEWTLQEPKMPLYGYNSFTFDEVAVGSRIINGSFIINYTIPDYLHQIDILNQGNNSDANVVYSSEGKQYRSNHDDRFKYMPQNFTIQIGHGDPKDKISGVTKTFLEQVHIQTMGHLIADDGSPVYEQYSFIARDINYIR